MFKKKRWAASLAAVAMAVMMSCGAATPAFAYYDESAASESTESAVEVEETIEETTEADTSENETETADDSTRDVSGALTPDGSLTLVDDLDEDESEAMQFMTVTTRDGSYYYIIIDRSGTSENVYFLNAVDTVDLMNLMSDDEKVEFTGEDEESTETVLTPTIIDDQTEEEDVDDNEAASETESKTNYALPMLGIFGVIGILIAGAYYMLKIKPKKGQGSIDEDREFYDDEEYENEDEVTTEDEFEEDEE